MLKCRIRNFFLNNNFEETYKDCFEKDNIAFVIEGKELLCCLKDSKGYKIQKRILCKNVKTLCRHNDGTIIV